MTRAILTYSMLILGSVAVASADPVTFATWNQINGPSFSILNIAVSGSYINDLTKPNPCGQNKTACVMLISGNKFGAGAANNVTINSDATWASVTTQATPSAVGVNFNFQQMAGLPASLQGTLTANMTMKLISTTPELAGFCLGTSIPFNTCIQQMDSGVIDFTLANSYVAAHPELQGFNDLLKVTAGAFTSQGLHGNRNTQNANLDALTDSGDIMTFSSNFLSFTNSVSLSLTQTFTTVSPCVTKSSSTLATCTSGENTLGQFLHSAKLNGTGSFASDPVPPTIYDAPEPGTVVFLGLGVGMLFVGRLRRRTV